jgi:hypothetical protein
MKRINGAESQIRPEAVRQHPSSFIADKMKLFRSKERRGSYFLDFKTVKKNNKFLDVHFNVCQAGHRGKLCINCFKVC